MTPRAVYDWYKLIFPQFAEHTVEWFPNGKNSVRVRQSNKQDFVFTYRSKKNWTFETVDSYLDRMKKG